MSSSSAPSPVAFPSGGGSASETSYDNSGSGLASTDVQGAIDELAIRPVSIAGGNATYAPGVTFAWGLFRVGYKLLLLRGVIQGTASATVASPAMDITPPDGVVFQAPIDNAFLLPVIRTDTPDNASYVLMGAIQKPFGQTFIRLGGAGAGIVADDIVRGVVSVLIAEG